MTLTKLMTFNLTRCTILILSVLIMSACGGGKQSDHSDDKFTKGGKKDSTEKKGKQKGGETFHRVPTPGHMLSIFEGYEGKAKKELLLSPEKAKDLVSSDQKALHLGIYSTDLAYSSVFGMGSKALSYFKTVRKLGEDLDVSSAFDKKTIKKIEKAVGQEDSLKNISKDTYVKAFNYLEKNDRGKTLALLVAGGWTEALYLSVNMVDEYKKDDPMVQYVADQKASFENLRKFMKKYDENKSVARVLTRMKGLKKAYAKLETKGGSTNMQKKEGGKMVLKGGPSLQIDKKGLDRIRKEANALRQAIVKGKITSSS